MTAAGRTACVLFLLALFAIFCCVKRSAAQDPPVSPPPQTSTSPSSSSVKTSGKRYSHQNDFLVQGTVFNERALSFPGVELKIRRVGEKKFRWTTYTNSRGEFAVRVPQGAEYEIVVRSKGFTEQTRTVDAKKIPSDGALVFRMAPQKEGK
jgi:hypothetical protein